MTHTIVTAVAALTIATIYVLFGYPKRKPGAGRVDHDYDPRADYYLRKLYAGESEWKSYSEYRGLTPESDKIELNDKTADRYFR